ncbi:MAG: hypothetical protein KKD18_02145 [Nanoarchaeota archaeon]|nr:hypothetical protein [Nanoarchaeota archaeon]MBU0977192.1 hypothetical protein [Nanoarchaeota archaeon]
MKVFAKRGLSPVVATALLVSITLILAVIIFFWAREFIGESINKAGSAIENSCELVDYAVEARGGQLFVTNMGTVPIYALEMRVSGLGEVKSIGKTGATIANGQSANWTLPSQATIGDVIITVPILLGETTTEQVAHVCDADYGRETTYLN